MSGLKSVLNDLPENGSAAVQCHGTLIALILHNYDPSFVFDQWKSMTMPDIYQINYDSEKIQFIYSDDNSKELIGRISIRADLKGDQH